MYLIAYYYQKPAHDRVRTAQAGWMKQPNNLSWDEQVALSIKLKNKDISMVKVILDLRNRKVVRNALNDNRDYNDLFEYYAKNYPKHEELMRSVDLAVKKAAQKEFVPEISTQVRIVDTPTV